MSTWIKDNASSVRLGLYITTLLCGVIYAEVEFRSTLRMTAVEQVKTAAIVTATSDKVKSLERAKEIYESEMPTVKSNIKEIKDKQQANAQKMASIETSVKDLKESQKTIENDIKEILKRLK